MQIKIVSIFRSCKWQQYVIRLDSKGAIANFAEKIKCFIHAHTKKKKY